MTLLSTTAAKDPADAMFAWFRTMLATQPVSVDDDQVWHVFSYADISRILSDPTTFSSDTARAFNPPQPDLDLFDMGNLVTKDSPRHRKLRTLVSQVFTPRVVAGLAPRITEIVISLLDNVGSADRFDLIETLAYPLPITVIAEALGVPVQDEPLFRVWGEALGAVDARTVSSEEMVNVIAPAVQEMNEYLLAHIRRRRQQPASDLIGRLAAAEVDGERLADGEIVGISGLVMFAGHATTMALLGNAVLCFDRYPEAMAAVRADRNLLPASIEEVLRFRPPFPRLARITMADTEIGGHAVPAGRLVTPWIAAANRDAARFPEPDRFDIHRNNTGHLVFGHGIHFCLGAPLARLEAKIALNILLERYQDIAVDHAGSLEFEDPWQIISPRRLPIHVTR